MKPLYITLISFFCLWSCQSDPNSSDQQEVKNQSPTQFILKKSRQTGINFSNTIAEDQQKNYFNFEYIYMGGGVGMGDINNDGLLDLYFSGNQQPNKLYLNKGGFKFEDITAKAGVAGDEHWYTGVNMVDINADGLLDIYVCKGGWEKNFTRRKNELFINNGDLTFTESAKAYGLDESGHSIQASFFDYDLDGDLDVYITNHPINYNLSLQERLQKRTRPDEAERDKLYQNNGDNTFTEVARAAGIVNYGHGLGLVTADINQDGYPDIYVANDYKEPDYLYINDGNGRFVNKIETYTGHISFNSMGVDIADINNDGYEDIFVTEMLPDDHKRSKTNMAPMNAKMFFGMLQLGLHYQYMQNTFQLNRGPVPGNPSDVRFSEVGQLAGLAKTDWSWACLMEDFDNDGFKDIFIANGFKRDVFDNDYKAKAEEEAKKRGGRLSLEKLYEIMPATKLSNFFYHNKGDGLSFENKSKAWGLGQETLSQGAVTGDLDNDGDLDLVVNNLDQEAFIYENQSEHNGNHYLQLQLEAGDGHPLSIIGTKVTLKNKGQLQFQALKSARGYQSSPSRIMHFGLGKTAQVEQIIISWTDGKKTILEDVATDQLLTVSYADAQAVDIPVPAIKSLFVDQTSERLSPVFKHQENDFYDFQNQVLLPHSMSKLGPFFAVGDLNGDQLEDFFVGGASKQAGAIYLQQQNGSFKQKKEAVFESDRSYEDQGACLFDADQDGDLDLYVVSGGAEFKAKTPFYQDRLYLNNGNADFVKSQGLPSILGSGSCVKAADYDKDGDLDLFVGGRVFPDFYPSPTKSYLLQNNGGQFVDVSMNIAPGLSLPGMVTDAVWTDINEDGWEDIIVVGEWMSIRIFQNQNGQRFADVSEQYGTNDTNGWWNRIIASDYDQDGDMDYIVGNLGKNYKFKASPETPFHVYSGDFDRNGTYDIILAKDYQKTLVPVRGRECSSEQMPFIKEKFPTFSAFSEASVADIMGADIEQALHYQLTHFQSVLLQKEGAQLKMIPLPKEAQFAPVNGILAEDFDQDGSVDLIIGGNMFGSEPETAKADAAIGLLLRQTEGRFKAESALQSGIYWPGDVKDVQSIKIGKEQQKGILVANNNAAIQLLVAQ